MPRRTTKECRELMKSPSGTLPDFGAIFMSNRSTKEECLKTNLLGLPRAFASFVEKVKIGMVLFLFEYEQRKLYGVFEAISDGALNIVPHAYSSSGKQFSAQVRISTIWCCEPLSEHEFRGAIKDNYFSANKFNFGLSKDQVHRLLWLFDSRKVRIRKSLNLLTKTNDAKRCRRKSSKKGRAVEKGRSITAETTREKLHMDIAELVIVTEDTKLSDSSLNPSANSDHVNHAKDNSIPECVHKLCCYDTILRCRPPTPSGQYSSVSGTGFGSTSLCEIGAHRSYACRSPSSTSLDLEQNVDVSCRSLTAELGDYIPLPPSPDHCDPIETEFSLLDNVDRPIFSIIPETSPSHQAFDSSKVGFPPSSMVDCCLKERAPRLESQKIQHGESNDNDISLTTKGLYSDTEVRKSVFSRLTMASKSIVQEEKEFTTANKSVQEILDKLQQRHNNWSKKTREVKFSGHENEDNILKRRTSAFSRLSLASKAVDDQDPQDAWSSGRAARDSQCLNFKRKHGLLKTQSVATERLCSEFPECNSFEKPCKRRLLSIICEPSQESRSSCQPPINRSARVDDELKQVSQKDLPLTSRCPVSCEIESNNAGEMLTRKDLVPVEMVSTDAVAKPLITYKRHRFAAICMHDPNEEIIVDEGKSESLKSSIKTDGA